MFARLTMVGMHVLCIITQWLHTQPGDNNQNVVVRLGHAWTYPHPQPPRTQPNQHTHTHNPLTCVHIHKHKISACHFY